MGDAAKIGLIVGSAAASGGLIYIIRRKPTITPATVDDIIKAYPKAKPIAQDIVNLANELGIPDPGWLANLINFESGFSPSIRNSKSGATGLIQFMPSTAEDYGTTTGALASMSAKTQWSYVRRYLKRKPKKFSEPTDVYMAVFYPWAMGRGRDISLAEHWAGQRSGRSKETFIRQNGGIETAQDYADYANKKARLHTGNYDTAQRRARNISLSFSAAALMILSGYMVYDYWTGE